MLIRIASTLVLLLITATTVTGQQLSVPTTDSGSGGAWKPSLARPAPSGSQPAAAPQFNPGTTDSRANTTQPNAAATTNPVATTKAINTTPDTSAPITNVVKGSGVLPNEQGQVWRESALRKNRP